MRSLEEQVLGAERIEGIVLRYGAFYGPGVGSTEAWVERLRRRKLVVMPPRYRCVNVGREGRPWSGAHQEVLARPGPGRPRR